MVLTTGGYVVAEYYEHSGQASWKRIVVSAQKASIEQWLAQHFPPSTSSPKAKK